MEEFILEVERRGELGRRASHRYRKAGFVPSVMYHRGEESVPLLTPSKEFLHLAQKARPSQVFLTKSKDSVLNGKSVLVKEIKRDYVSRLVLHVDFQVLKDDEEIHLSVALDFVGEAPGVKAEGGILTIISHELKVACLPRAIPNQLVVDISGLTLGKSVHAGDVPLPQGVRLHGSPEETIVSVVIAKQVVEETPAVATAAGATPAEGAPAAAPGATPTEGADKEKGKK